MARGAIARPGPAGAGPAVRDLDASEAGRMSWCSTPGPRGTSLISAGLGRLAGARSCRRTGRGSPTTRASLTDEGAAGLDWAFQLHRRQAAFHGLGRRPRRPARGPSRRGSCSRCSGPPSRMSWPCGDASATVSVRMRPMPCSSPLSVATADALAMVDPLLCEEDNEAMRQSWPEPSAPIPAHGHGPVGLAHPFAPIEERLERIPGGRRCSAPSTGGPVTPTRRGRWNASRAGFGTSPRPASDACSAPSYFARPFNMSFLRQRLGGLLCYPHSWRHRPRIGWEHALSGVDGPLCSVDLFGDPHPGYPCSCALLPRSRLVTSPSSRSSSPAIQADHEAPPRPATCRRTGDRDHGGRTDLTTASDRERLDEGERARRTG